jgi:hypothetical protein
LVVPRAFDEKEERMMIELLLTLWLGLTMPQAAHLTHGPGGELGPEVAPGGLAATAGTAGAGERGPMVDPGGVPLAGGSGASGEEDSELGPMIDPEG